jgi:sec-independent protein translocase protein TatC
VEHQDMSDQQVDEKTMSIWDHLAELRQRVLISLLVLVATTLVSFMFATQIADILARPIGGLYQLKSIEVTENISVFMNISLLSGFICALPFILFELLGFVLPGLTPREKFWIQISIPLATLFFLSGVLFAYFVMLPTAVPFLISFMGINTMVRPGNYFDFILNLLFWIGISFELPLVIFVLAKINIINASMLIKQWRIAIVVIAIFAAVITPTPDPVNMGLLMIPLTLLYVLSILFAYLAQPKSGKAPDEVKP